MRFEPRFATIAIGSLPHTDPVSACKLMLEAFEEVACWPQLPQASFKENMYAQYSEGMPGIVLDEEARRLWFQVDDSFPGQLTDFYQAVIDEDPGRFKITSEYAAGLDVFLSGDFAPEIAGRPYVKGQMTGPISYGLTVTDQFKKASLYHEDLQQAIVKALTLIGAWQSNRLKKCVPGAKVIMFYDEPYLHSVGSALINVSREQVAGNIKECLGGCGADITGVHCCGNTDWSLVFDSGVNIIHFDAFEYMEPFVAYDGKIAEHLARGGALAWGVIPKDESVFTVSSDELVGVLEGGFDILEGRGVERNRLARQSMVSTSCGLGSATVEVAGQALELMREVSDAMRKRYF